MRLGDCCQQKSMGCMVAVTEYVRAIDSILRQDTSEEGNRQMKSETKFLICLIVCLWLPLYMGAFDKDKPSASTSLRSSNPEILANWSQIQTALNLDHEFAGTASGTQTGKHEVLTMQEESSAGASSTNEGHFQIIDGGSQPELAFTSEDGDELQFTKDGDLYSSDNLVIDGTSTLTGAVAAAASITLGAGADLIGSSTSDITFNTNKFTVAGATGNTIVAGTLDVTGNIDPTTYETANGGFLDEDAMGSDAADKVASQQSIKAYVDAQTPAAAGLAKAWVQHAANGTIAGTGYNITSTARDSAGNYTVTWDTDFANDDYAVSIVPNGPDLNFATVTAISVGSISYVITDRGANQNDADCYVIAMGRQ